MVQVLLTDLLAQLQDKVREGGSRQKPGTTKPRGYISGLHDAIHIVHQLQLKQTKNNPEEGIKMARPHIQPVEMSISREVHEALLELHKYKNPGTLYSMMTRGYDDDMSQHLKTLQNWVRDIQLSGEVDHGQKIMQLLTGQYTVTATPEDEFQQMIQKELDIRRRNSTRSDEHLQASHRLRAFVDAAEALEIKIKAKLPAGYLTSNSRRNPQAHAGSVPHSMGPVHVTQEQVEAVSQLRRSGYDDTEIFTLCSTSRGKTSHILSVQHLAEWAETQRNTSALLKLLAGVYLVDHTKEYLLNKVLQDYQGQINNPTLMQGRVEKARAVSIALLEVADLFNLELENDPRFKA